MPEPYLDDGDCRVYFGDCIEVMATLEDASFDAVVCDPPYGLEFMGKEWDSFGRERAYTPRSDDGYGDKGVLPGYGRGGTSEDRDRFKRKANNEFQAWCESWAREAFRVLKPGGHLAAFGGTRTYHRLTCGIEDAGFEIRDTLAWLYGSGFPKSLDVSKAIDKAAGAEREVIGVDAKRAALLVNQMGEYQTDAGWRAGNRSADITAPATTEAEQWQGWGTALKPAHEPVVLARRPLVGTVSRNVLEHGTGALNIDATRIGIDEAERGIIDSRSGSDDGKREGIYSDGVGKRAEGETFKSHADGRWPANVILDEAAGAMLDAQTGDLQAGASPAKLGLGSARVYGDAERSGVEKEREQLDGGGASRFFYTAKASRSERNDGLGALPLVAAKRTQDGGDDTRGRPTPLNRNTHPTVKPVDVMRWLLRLVTPPGGVVLDPFLGSGTTAVAARLEGFRCVGIEQSEEYCRIAAGRLAQQTLL